MKPHIGKLKGKAIIVFSLVALMLMSVLAGTVYAVTLSGVDFGMVAAFSGGGVSDGTYTISVTSTYAPEVNDADHYQTIQIYNDTTQSAAASGVSSASYAMPSDNTTPAINVKSNNKVSVTGVVVTNSSNEDVTVDAFGGQARYDYFIESTKSSLFGYFELQNITDDVNVAVTYGEPVEELYPEDSSIKYYSVTVVTKGDVGPYNKVHTTDERTGSSVYFSSVTYSNYTDGTYSNNNNNYALDIAYASGRGTSGFSYGTYSVNGSCSRFVPFDGSQMTRYCFSSRTMKFNNTNYSYVDSIEAYYNDDGSAANFDFSGMTGSAISCADSGITYTPDTAAPRSLTFVVTYKEMPAKVVYTKLSYKLNATNYKVGITCPDSASASTFQHGHTAAEAWHALDNSQEPLSTYPSYDRNRTVVVDSDKIRLCFDPNDTYKNRDSVQFSDVKVYSLDVDSLTAPDDVTDQFTIAYHNRSTWDEDGYVDISGLNSYDGNIYVSASVRYYNKGVRIRTKGAHTDSLIVTANNAMAKLGGREYDSSNFVTDSEMANSVTLDPGTSYTDRNMYGGGEYVLRSSGSMKLTDATFYYQSASTGWTTKTYPADENGVITMTLPDDIYHYDAISSRNLLTVSYEALTTKKAQIYIAQNNTNASFNNVKFMKVTTVDSSDTPASAMFRTYDNTTTAYSSKYFSDSTELPSSPYAYQIIPGTKVNLEYTLNPADSGTNFSNLSQDRKDFINSRIEFLGFKVYKMSGSNVGDELTVTESGGVYSFTMPANSDVRIAPVFRDHIHSITVVGSDRDTNGRNYRIDKSTRGTGTLVANDGSFFEYCDAGTNPFNNSYLTASNITDTWAYNRYDTIDGTSFTLTATPKSENGVQTYKVTGVKAYWYQNNNNAARGYIYSSDSNSTSYSFLSYDSNGDVTNTDLSGTIVGELSEPDAETGARTCQITLPRSLANDGNKGHIVICVEFENNLDNYADFKYEATVPDRTSAVRPYTTFDGSIQDVTGTLVATDGTDQKAEYYDDTKPEAERKTLTMTIGSDSQSNASCAFYYTNLLYNVTNYAGDTSYGSFRVFKGEIKDITGTVGNYIDLANASFSHRSSTNYSPFDKLELTIKLPKDEGIKISCTPQETYIPVTIKQYLVDSEGNVSAAPEGFSATVTQYLSSNSIADDYIYEKYFTKTYTDDYYSILSNTAAESFTTSFTVSAGDPVTRNMALSTSGSQGYYLVSSAPDGYRMTGIRCMAYDLNNKGCSTDYSSSYFCDRYTNNNIPTSVQKYSSGYRIYSNCSGFMRSDRQEVEIYYSEPAKLTLHQHVTGVLENNNNLASVSITNDGGTLLNSNMTPYICDDENYPFRTSLTPNPNRNNRTSYEGEENYWEMETAVSIGTAVRISITPQGSRSISKIEFYTLDGDEHVNVPHTLVSGTGSVGSQTVYKLNSPIAAGDDIHIDVTYGTEQSLEVIVYKYDNSNAASANSSSVTGATVTVTGTNQDSTDPAYLTPFHRSSSAETFGEFTVESNDSVLYYQNLNLNIATGFAGSSDYVVAYVDLQQYSGSYWSSVSGLEARKIYDDDNNEIGKDYSECTVTGITTAKSMRIIVYLMKTARMTVAVHTYDTSGTLYDGVPNRWNGTGPDVTDAKVVFTGRSSTGNTRPFVTDEGEGKYSTGDFELTYGENNSSRTVQVLQGTTFGIYSKLPESGDYVVKKVTGSGFTTGLGTVKTETDDEGNTFLKTTITTDGTVYPNHVGGYRIDVYIAPAKSIITQTRTYAGVDPSTGEDRYTSPNGTVTVYADDVEADVIAFTQIYPSMSAFNTGSYTASTNYTSKQPYYTTITKCQARTKLHFTVKPNSNFVIKSVTAHQGSPTGSPIMLRRSQPTSDGTVTYTLMSGSNRYEMPELENVYLDVVFDTKTTGSVKLDYKYSDDFSTWNEFFGDKAVGTISGSNSNSAYKDVYKLTKGALSADSFAIENSDDAGVTYTAITGTTVSVSAGTLNNQWYMPVEAWITDSAGVTVKTFELTGDTFNSMSYVVNTDDVLTFHARYIPVAHYSFKTIDNNVYTGSPSGVDTTDKTKRNITTITGANDNRANPVYSVGEWTTNSCVSGKLADGTDITNINVLYSEIYPGDIKKIRVYEFEKGADTNDLANGTLIADVYAQNEPYPQYGYYSLITNNGGTYQDSFNYDPNITVSAQKQYVFYLEIDLINVYVSCNSGDVNSYLVYADNKNFKLYDDSTLDSRVRLTLGFAAEFDCQLSEGFRHKSGPAYFVLESAYPRETLKLTSAKYKDYKDKTELNILSELTTDENYKTVAYPNGSKRYYYIYEIQPDDPIPVDNSMEFKLIFRRISNTGTTTDPHTEDLTSAVTVTQYDRVSYTEYVRSALDTSEISHTDGTALKVSGDDTDYESVTLPFNGRTDVQLVSTKGKELMFVLTPREGYNVEKIVINDSSTTTLYPKDAEDEDGLVYLHTIKSSSVNVNIYYTQPTLRIQTTNKADNPNVAVDMIEDGTVTRLIRETDYIKDTLVTKGDSKTLRIIPSEYETTVDGNPVTKKYTIDYITVGDAYDTTMTVYDATRANPNISNDYFIEQDEDGNYTMSIDSIDDDVYIFIQMMGEVSIRSSELQVRHHILNLDTNEYVNCDEDYPGGTVTTCGTLDGNDAPLTNGEGESCSSFLLGSTEYSVSGLALSGTTLEFDVQNVPDNFRVMNVTGKFGDSTTLYHAYPNDNGKYQFSFTAPNSGVLYVDVYYGINLTEFTLNYHYNGRKGGNNGSSYSGDDGEEDPMVYTKTVSLTDSFINEGKPLISILTANAPAVDDIYKNCKWTIDDKEEHSDLVSYDTENHKVDIYAVQETRNYSVVFNYGDKVQNVAQVPLNSLVKVNGSFVTAPEKDAQENEFAYWKVEEYGKEIARCYSRSFNLRVTGDLTVTAMYSAEANMLYIGDPRYTRQQYTSGGENVDKLQVDFLLAYMEENGLLLNSKLADDSGYKSGLVVEYFDNCRLEKEDEPGGILNDDDIGMVELPGVNAASIENLVKDTGNTAVNDHQRLLKYTVPNSYYNNKNRVDRAIKFDNSEDARHQVFRAYYYVSHVEDGETVVELSEPVVFCLYEIGNTTQNTEEG